MSIRFPMLVALALSLAVPAAAGIEDQVRGLVQAGEILPFQTIQRRVASEVKGDYIGAEFDAPTLTYRFRFLVDGSVINVIVDARTGRRARQASY